MINPIYNLPNIDFVGGETIKVLFKLHSPSGAPFSADGCNAVLSVINYINKSGPPTFSVRGLIQSSDDGVNSQLMFEIPSEKTLNLFGKYVYQFTIINEYGLVDVPGKGFMNITKNIDPKAVDIE